MQGIAATDADEISDAEQLWELVDDGGCVHMRTTLALAEECDLDKDPRTRVGCCSANPKVACHLKRHTVLLKRYGHFGKVPTSIALMVRESGAEDLSALRRLVMKRARNPLARAQELERELSRAWRVSQKIASMFLSMVTNPDLSRGLAPWSRGIDWTYYVVVDSNVDLFLASIGYHGGGRLRHPARLRPRSRARDRPDRVQPDAAAVQPAHRAAGDVLVHEHRQSPRGGRRLHAPGSSFVRDLPACRTEPVSRRTGRTLSPPHQALLGRTRRDRRMTFRCLCQIGILNLALPWFGTACTPPLTMMSEILNSREAAVPPRVARDRVCSMEQRGKLLAFKGLGGWRLCRAALDSWISTLRAPAHPRK